jgi:hypothetical protein
MIVLFLSGMVAVILFRVLRRDITNYNQLEGGEEAAEETGWKLVGRLVGLNFIAGFRSWFTQQIAQSFRD